jgi:hypothetical protein
LSRIALPLSRSISYISKAWPWLPYDAPFGLFAALTTLMPMISIGAGVATDVMMYSGTDDNDSAYRR